MAEVSLQALYSCAISVCDGVLPQDVLLWFTKHETHVQVYDTRNELRAVRLPKAFVAIHHGGT